MTMRQGIDEAKLEAFVGQGVNDFGAMLTSALVVIGDKLGLYRAMAGAGPLTSVELAQRTGTTERYCGIGSSIRPRADTSTTTLRPSATRCRTNMPSP